MAKKLKIPKKLKPAKTGLVERIILGIVMTLPLIISIGTIISVKIINKAPVVGVKGIQMSPVVNPGSLILGLSIFSIVYITLIVILFYANVKKMLTKYEKKVKH